MSEQSMHNDKTCTFVRYVGKFINFSDPSNFSSDFH